MAEINAYDLDETKRVQSESQWKHSIFVFIYTFVTVPF